MKAAFFLLAGVLAFVPACGPAALGAGIGELARNGKGQTIVLLFVNDSGEPVQLRLDGVGADGAALKRVLEAVPANGRAEVELPRALGLRVRGSQTAADAATPPVTWDFRLEDPTSGAGFGLGTESAVVSGLRPTATAGDRLVVDRLVGGVADAAFVRRAAAELPGSPTRFAMHPGGGYCYSVRDLGGRAELTAWRLDARTAALEPVAAEFGATPENPRTIDHAGSFAALDVAVCPLGRVLYVVQRLPASHRSMIDVLPILDDGSLGAPTTTVRGLIGDLAIRADGRRLYVTEDLGDGRGFELKDFALDGAGRIDFLAASSAMPCVTTEGGRIALHPTGRQLYVALRDPVSGLAKVGAYFVGDNGGAFSLGADCSGFETVEELAVDTTGATLYVTGTAIGGATRVLRYALDPVSGALGTLAAQDLGVVARVAASSDPARAAADPLRAVVLVSVGDRLVPHLRQPDGSLDAVSSGAALDHGAPTNTHFVAATCRGVVTATN